MAEGDTATEGRRQGDEGQEAEAAEGGLSGKLRAIAALAVVGTSVFLYVRFHHYLTVSSLRRNHEAVLATVAANPRLAPLCYIGTLVLVIGLTCPGATMLSFVGGILFEQPYASLYAYTGYIIGATISFFVTTVVLGDFMRRKLASKSGLYKKFEANVKRNAFMYLVVARYTMVFPFFFVNAAAALVGVHWRTFVAATSVSCIPGSVIYTTAGAALASMLHKLGEDEAVDKSELMWAALQDPNVRACIAGISMCLAILGAVKLFSPSEGDPSDKSE